MARVPKSPATKTGSGNGTRYAPETKSEVMAALLQGQSPAFIEHDRGIPADTVYEWAKDLGGIEALRQGRVGDLVYRLLQTNLETLEIQSRTVGTAAYVEGKPAGEIAVLYGVIADKTIRILGALERAQSPPDPLA